MFLNYDYLSVVYIIARMKYIIKFVNFVIRSSSDMKDPNSVFNS